MPLSVRKGTSYAVWPGKEKALALGEVKDEYQLRKEEKGSHEKNCRTVLRMEEKVRLKQKVSWLRLFDKKKKRKAVPRKEEKESTYSRSSQK